MSQMWALPEDVLSSDQKQELAKLLQKVEEDKGDEGKLRKAGRAVADWAFENAMKSIPTIMPFIAQTIKNGMG